MEIEMHAVALSVDCPHPPLKELIFKGSLIGSTPLILACHCGDFDSVKRIIEHWGAEVNEAAIYLTNPVFPVDFYLLQEYYIKIETATPLFIAASNGHTKIVRYLIEKRADVSARTRSRIMKCYDGLTPLYGAVCELCTVENNLIYKNRMKEESASIVRLLLESGADASLLSSRPSDGSPIWMKIQCRADVITELINHDMDLKQCDQFTKGTVLHYWAGGIKEQEESLTIVKLLIEKGADLLALDFRGFTPLSRAAIGRADVCINVEVLDFLLERSDYSRAEKIEAMELAGAVILGNKKNASKFPKAFEYWRKALLLCKMAIEGSTSPSLSKTRLNLKSVRTVEWITSAEREDVIEHPETYMIQSFLVRLRIFSYKRWKAIESLFLFEIQGDGFRELRIRRFVDILDMIWAMLETLLFFYPREIYRVKRMADKVVKHFLLVLSHFERDSSEFWDVSTIKTSLELIAATTEFYCLSMESLFQLAALLSAVPPKLLNDHIMEIVYQLIRRNRRDNPGLNLLHSACMYPYCDKESLFRLLLQAGSSPNAIDSNGNTPLHLILIRFNGRLSDSMNIIARLLLDFGAKLSIKNSSGETVADLVIEMNGRKRRLEKDNFIEGDDLPDWCLELPALTCLSARAIRYYRSPHLALPSTLISMIEKYKITL